MEAQGQPRRRPGEERPGHARMPALPVIGRHVGRVATPAARRRGISVPMSRVVAVLGLLGLLGPVLAGCIERPLSSREAAKAVDRARLADVVSAAPPAPAHRVEAVFGDAIELIGYEATPEPARRGAEVSVTFWWRARAEVDEDWQVFVHLDDETRRAGRVIADHFPAQGRYRTPAWRAGDVVKDTWRFTAPEGEADELSIWTGFYRGDARLPVSQPGRALHDGVNRVRAGTIALQ
jgi:hypothetical protein